MENFSTFLDNRADIIDAQDEDSKTALMLATDKGQLEVVNVLIAKGADIHAQDKKGRTALCWANRHLEIKKALKEATADTCRNLWKVGS